MEPISLSKVIKQCKPPSSINSYSPPDDVLYHGSGKKQQRNIFKCQKFNQRELEKLRRLKEMIKKQKLTISDEWDDGELLKFVYGSGFKTKSAFKALKSCLQSREEVLTKDFLLLYGKIFEILVWDMQKTGPLYFHGRDCHFRPLLIMNFSKFDLKKYPFELYLQSACFVLEFAARYMLMPGKVENWLCISDLGFRGLTDLPLNTLRKITKVLQDIFKCRMAYSTMINVPNTIYFIYSCLKPFLDEITIDKITIEKGNIPTKIISFFNPYQVEKRYGGKAEDLEVFWPPFFPDCPVSLQENPKNHVEEIEIVEENHLIVPEPEIIVHSQELFVKSHSDEEVLEEIKQGKEKKKRRKKKKVEKNKFVETHEVHIEVENFSCEENLELTDEIKVIVMKKPSEENLQAEPEEGKEEIVMENQTNSTYCSWEFNTCVLQ